MKKFEDALRDIVSGNIEEYVEIIPGVTIYFHKKCLIFVPTNDKMFVCTTKIPYLKIATQIKAELAKVIKFESSTKSPLIWGDLYDAMDKQK